MPAPAYIPERNRFVTFIAPQVTTSAINGDTVSMKNVKEMLIIVEMKDSVGTSVTLSLYQATAISGGTYTALTKTVPVFVTANTASSDLLTREDTDTVSYTTATLANKRIAFKVTPEDLDDGYTAIQIRTTAGASTCLISVVGIIDPYTPGENGRNTLVD